MLNRTELAEKLEVYLLKRSFSIPLTQSELDEAYDLGLLRKSELGDGKYYYGDCRNASVARWDAKKQKFTYMRTKFKFRFPEDINHPENDNMFDLFEPIGEVEPEPNEVITEGNT